MQKRTYIYIYIQTKQNQASIYILKCPLGCKKKKSSVLYETHASNVYNDFVESSNGQ